MLSFFFFKQKTAYEMRISDWSSDVCSSDLFMIDVQAAAESQEVIRSVNPSQQIVKIVHDELKKLMVDHNAQIGRASCRERVCQYVSIAVVAVSLKKKHKTLIRHTNIHL